LKRVEYFTNIEEICISLTHEHLSNSLSLSKNMT